MGNDLLEDRRGRVILTYVNRNKDRGPGYHGAALSMTGGGPGPHNFWNNKNKCVFNKHTI